MGTRPLAEYDSAWEYLLPEGLGSVRQLVDASGNVKLAESYEPYGSVLSSQGSAASAFGFTGEQLDSYIELLFLRARYMQPTLGMFLSRDTWESECSQNGFNYVDATTLSISLTQLVFVHTLLAVAGTDLYMCKTMKILRKQGD